MSRSVVGSVLGAAALALLAACGGDVSGAGSLQVEILWAGADGSAPAAGWRLLPEAGGSLPLTPVAPIPAGSLGHVLEAHGPAGRYGIAGPEGWSLVGGSVLFALQPGLPPLSLGVGRAGAIYLVPPDGTEVRDVVVTLPDGKPLDPATRFDRASGTDRRCILRPSGGPPLPKDVYVFAALSDGTFAEPVRVQVPPSGVATGAGLSHATNVPLEVLVTDLATGAPASGYRVGVHLVMGPLALDRDPQPTDAHGTLVLLGMPTALDPGSHLVGDAGGFWPIGVETLREGVLRVARVPRDGPSGVLRVLSAANSQPGGTLELRPEAADVYGLVAVARPGAGTATLFEARVPIGRYSVLVRDGDRVFVLDDLVDVRKEAKAEVRYEGVPSCHVQVHVEGGIQAGRRLTLRAYRLEGKHAVLAQGFEARRLARADHELHLPTGHYRLVLVDGDREGPPHDLVLARPGSQAVVRLYGVR